MKEKNKDQPVQPNQSNPNDALNELLNKFKGMMDQPDSMLHVIVNDERLRKVTEYEVTKGFTNLKVTPEELQQRFTEFKVMVMTKEATLAELETLVYNKYGISEQPRDKAPETEKRIIGFGV